jgi:hypothetical protein
MTGVSEHDSDRSRRPKVANVLMSCGALHGVNLEGNFGICTMSGWGVDGRLSNVISNITVACTAHLILV